MSRQRVKHLEKCLGVCLMTLCLVFGLYFTVRAENAPAAPEIVVENFRSVADSGALYTVPVPRVTPTDGAEIVEQTVTVYDAYGDSVPLGGGGGETGHSFTPSRTSQYYDVKYFAKDSNDKSAEKTLRVTVADGFSKMNLTSYFSTDTTYGHSAEFFQERAGIAAKLGKGGSMIQYSKPIPSAAASTIVFRTEGEKKGIDIKFCGWPAQWWTQQVYLQVDMGAKQVKQLKLDGGALPEKIVEYTPTEDNVFTVVYDPAAKKVTVNGGIIELDESNIADGALEADKYLCLQSISENATYTIRQIGDAVFTRPYADEIAPVLSVANQPLTLYSPGQSFAFTAAASDNLDDALDFYVKINDVFLPGKQVEFQENGEYVVALYVYDSCGNFAKTEDFPVTVTDDKEPPVIDLGPDYDIPNILFVGVPFVFPAAAVTDNVDRDITHTVRATNAGGGEMTVERVERDGVLTGWKVTPAAADLDADRDAQIVYTATDRAQNTRTVAVKVKVLGADALDAVGPQVRVGDFGEAQSEIYTDILLPGAAVADNFDDKVKTYFEILLGESVMYRSQNAANAAFSEEQRTIQLYAPGVYTLRYTAVDDYANVTTEAKTFVVHNKLMGLDRLVELREGDAGKLEQTENGYKVTSTLHWSGGVRVKNQRAGQDYSLGLTFDKTTWPAAVDTAQLDIQLHSGAGLIYLQLKVNGGVISYLQKESGFAQLKSVTVPLNESEQFFELVVKTSGEITVNGMTVCEASDTEGMRFLDNLIFADVSPTLYTNKGACVFYLNRFGGSDVRFESGSLVSSKPALISHTLPRYVNVGEELTVEAQIFDLTDFFPTYTFSVKDERGSDVAVEGNRFVPAAKGVYTVTFSLATIDGRTSEYSYRLAVLDGALSAPVITVNGEYPAEAELNAVITVLSFSATDGSGLEPELSVTVYNPLGIDVAITDGKFTASREGTYIVKYKAVGLTGEAAEKSVRIVVKAAPEEKPAGCNAAVIGGTVGGVVGALAIISVVFILIGKRRSNHEKKK